MGRHAIPTASYRAFNNFPEAEQYLQQVEYKVVVKVNICIILLYLSY